jgi:oligoendopeptidase F
MLRARQAWVLLMLLLSGPVAVAQETFEPIPKESAPQYRFNFERHFFASPDAERADRQRAYAALAALETLKGRVAASADHLYRALVLADRVRVAFYRHTLYRYLRYAVNTADEASRLDASALAADLSTRTSFLPQELMRLEDQTLARFVRQKPALKTYAFAIASARRYRPHTLSLPEEELLHAAEPLISDWPAELYQKVRDRTPFGTVRTGSGDLDVYTQAGEIAQSPDRAVREAGFKQLYAGYAAHRDLYAFALSRLIQAANQRARLRHYQDKADEVLFGLFLRRPEVTRLYEQIARQAGLYRRYQRLRAERIQQLTGDDEVHYWDLSVIPPTLQRPRFTVGEATDIIREALAPFGAEYARELAALLDPANGRLDLVGDAHRLPGAFADGLLGHPISILFSFTYEGYVGDLETLAHEAGHAVHFQLMGNHRVRPAYAHGPEYLFESFAMFNELLVTDSLYQRATDPLRRTYFLEQFLGSALRVFGATSDAALEEAIYDAMASDTLLSADALDALAKRVGARFSIWYEQHDELQMRWIDVPHLYETPMYLVNYVYAGLLALTYYARYTHDPQQFTPRYLALMRHGFTAPPAVLLQQFLAVDLRAPHLVSDAVAVLEGKLNALEALYAQ